MFPAWCSPSISFTTFCLQGRGASQSLILHIIHMDIRHILVHFARLVKPRISNYSQNSNPIELPYCHVIDRNFCQSKFRHTVLFPPTHILEDIFTSCGLMSVYTVGSNADLTRFLIVMSNQTNKSNGMGGIYPISFSWLLQCWNRDS